MSSAPGAPVPLGPLLEELLRGADFTAQLARDPLRFPVRYAGNVADAEVAAVFAALLAFGRVDLFGPVLERIFVLADAAGGPAAWVDSFDDEDAERLAPIYYRWHRGGDFVMLARTLAEVRRRYGSVGALFRAGAGRTVLDEGLSRFAECVQGPPSRGFRTWLGRPSDGSACKRWCMLLRWMVRGGGGDLGVWTHLSAADLIMPMDTHVHRIARLLRLTSRSTADWRAAEEVTAALRSIDGADPVRFDFALAHLGISGACVGAFEPSVCPTCPLRPVCAAARSPGAGRPGLGAGATRRGRSQLASGS